jgi:diacylglycerol kinase family enzyme
MVMNPGSRSGRGRRLWGGWERGLKSAGVDYACVRTERPGHAFELARGAAGFDTVVAVGGDGTINEVLDGVMQSGHPALAMGVLYAGTSPDFCRFHGIPVDPAAALEALLERGPEPVDVGRITYVLAGGGGRVAHFGCSCNIGMGAAIARRANSRRRWLGDALGTGTALVQTMAEGARVDVELELDGAPLSLGEVNNISVVKNPFLASGLKLNLDVRHDDGNLWMVGIHGRSRLGMLGLVPALYSGEASAAAGVTSRRCRSVKVRAREPGEVEFDGDPRGFLPVSIAAVHRGLLLRGARHG